MPELRWVGKEKVVNHHLDVPFRTLRNVYTFTAEAHAAALRGEASEAASREAGSGRAAIRLFTATIWKR